MRRMVYDRKVGNEGMSLIELIIVVAIITAFVGTMSYSLNWASGKAAEECAKKLSYNLMQARTMAMGKNSVSIVVKKDTAGDIFTEMTIISNKDDGTTDTTTTTSKVGNKTVEVLFGNDGTAGSAIGEVMFEFDRASGALKKMKVGGVDTPAQTPSFTVSKGSTERIIDIVPITGRISLRK